MENRQSNPRVKTKIVVRNLPWNLTDEVFFKVIENHMANISYHYFVPGRTTSKREIPSVAFLTFLSGDSVLKFHDEFQGHLFVDPRGKAHNAQIEYAPYQKVPRKPIKPDPRGNTLDEDPDYKRYLDHLRTPDDLRQPLGDTILDDLPMPEKGDSASDTEPEPPVVEEKPKPAPKPHRENRKKGGHGGHGNQQHGGQHGNQHGNQQHGGQHGNQHGNQHGHNFHPQDPNQPTTPNYKNQPKGQGGPKQSPGEGGGRGKNPNYKPKPRKKNPNPNSPNNNNNPQQHAGGAHPNPHPYNPNYHPHVLNKPQNPNAGGYQQQQQQGGGFHANNQQQQAYWAPKNQQPQ